MLLQAFLFSAMDALVKLATARHPTGQIIFFRNFFALLPLYFFVRQAGGFGVLRTKQVVTSRKEGNQVFYSLRDPVLIEVLDILKRYFYSHLSKTMSMLNEIKSERASKR